MFVSCVVCLTLLYVHNLIVLRFKSHINPLNYFYPVTSLACIFAYTLIFLEEIIFSIKVFRMKDLVKIRDTSKIFNIALILNKNIMVLENGREICNNYRFFSYNFYFTIRN
jgi:hypothetical protein